jgi:hypothetical protein
MDCESMLEMPPCTQRQQENAKVVAINKRIRME